MYGSAYTGKSARRINLTHNLFVWPCSVLRAQPARIESGPNMTVVIILLEPPLKHYGKWLRNLIHFVVDLWRKIVYPSLFNPQTRIGIQVFVRIKPSCIFRKTRPPDSERADPKFNMWFCLFDAIRELLHQDIHIFPPPVSSRKCVSVLLCNLPALLVRKIGPVCVRRVGIKIVIKMNTSDIGALHNVHNDR